MEELIASALPLVEAEIIKKISSRLIDIGVLHYDDLQFVEESDIKDLMKPIQARKFLKFCKSFQDSSSDQSKILSKSILNADLTFSHKECSISPTVTAIEKSSLSDQTEILSKTTSSANPTVSHKECSESIAPLPFKNNSSIEQNKMLSKSVPSSSPTFSSKKSPGSLVCIPFKSNSSDKIKILTNSTQSSGPTCSLQECLVSSAVTPLKNNSSDDQDKTLNASILSAGPTFSKTKYPGSSQYTPLSYYALNFDIPWHLFPNAVLKACLEKTRLVRKDKCEMVRILIESALRINPFLCRRDLIAIAAEVVSKYPDTFQDQCDKSNNAGGHSSFLRNLVLCLENKRRKNRRSRNSEIISNEPPMEKKKSTAMSMLPNDRSNEESDDSLEDIMFTVKME